MNPWMPENNPETLRRLGKSVEELGELVSILGRAICQGLGESHPVTGKSNLEAITEETADVMAQLKCNAETFGIDHKAVNERVRKKYQQMLDWEAKLKAPTLTDKVTWSPKKGELVRTVVDGTLAGLALHDLGSPVGSRYQGIQYAGAFTEYDDVRRPSVKDRLRWVKCAMHYRNLSREEATLEAWLS